MNTQNIAPNQGTSVYPTEELAYTSSLLLEGLNIADPNQQEDHFGAVAELLDEVDLSEDLLTQTDTFREATLANIEASRIRRAKIAAYNMEVQGFAYEAPNFGEQVDDKTRQTSYNYGDYVKSKGRRESNGDETEFEGLQELHTFLSLFLEEAREADGSYKYPAQAELAQSMLDNLTFIGESEYEKAVLGMAYLWKAYLNDDPDRQLCVLANISNSKQYPDERKSDDYLRDRILGTFSDDELQHYAGRIVKTVDDLTADIDKVRIILLDDWAISGSQMRQEYSELLSDPAFDTYDTSDCVEVNVIAASESRIQNGLEIDEIDIVQRRLPLRAYYQAHAAPVAQRWGESHITGIYSSTNYGFDHVINRGMVRTLCRLGKLKKGELPLGLANIVRPYRDIAPAIEITSTDLRRVSRQVSNGN